MRGGRQPGAGRPKGTRGIKWRKTVMRERREARALRLADVTPDRVMLELARCALSSLPSFYDEHGQLKAPKDLTVDQGAALTQLETVVKNLTAGDNAQEVVHKVKLHDKVKALELIGKHFGLFEDKRPVEGKFELVIKKPW